MADTIGSLNVKLSANTSEIFRDFNATSAKAEEVRKSFQRTQQAAASMGSSSGGSSKAARGFLELSRGVEDAASVYGTTGLAGAFRAASNNISQFASIIHPAAGAVTGLAVAAGSILIPKLFDTTKQTKEAARSMREFEESLNNTREVAKQMSEVRIGIRGIQRAGSEKELGGIQRPLEDKLAELRAQAADLAGIRKTLTSNLPQAPHEMEFKRKGLAIGVGEKVLGELDEARRKRTMEEINDLSRKKNDIDREILGVEKQLEAVQANMARVRKADAEFQNEDQVQRIIRQNNEAIARRNLLEAEGRRIGRSILDDLDEQGAKRRRIMDEWKDRQKEIKAAGFGEATENRLLFDARDAAGKKLRDARVEELMGKRDQAQGLLDVFRKQYSAPMNSSALIRGSAEEVTARIQATQKPVKDPMMEKLASAIEAFNKEIAKLTGKPLALVQGHF